jgi:hypothetical protein
MHSRRGVASKLAVFVALIFASATSVRADLGNLLNKTEARKLCYCGCDQNDGAPMCEHMCELPKYQGRWWATTCHKPMVGAGKKDPPPAHSKQNRRSEQAHLQ